MPGGTVISAPQHPVICCTADVWPSLLHAVFSFCLHRYPQALCKCSPSEDLLNAFLVVLELLGRSMLSHLIRAAEEWDSLSDC